MSNTWNLVWTGRQVGLGRSNGLYWTGVHPTPLSPAVSPVLVLGIDPGSTATGFAGVRRVRNRFVLVEAGVVRTRADDPMEIRLQTVHMGVVDAIARLRPDAVAIEAIFRHRSSESALRLGQARGVALLAAAQASLTVTDYNTMTVKKTIGGHGRAGKPEMVRIVSRMLGLMDPLAADAADAAAIAMTHLLHSHFHERVAATAEREMIRRLRPRSPLPTLARCCPHYQRLPTAHPG